MIPQSVKRLHLAVDLFNTVVNMVSKSSLFLFTIPMALSSPDPGSMSRVVFNEFSNLTEEQALIMAFNYTTTLFKADE